MFVSKVLASSLVYNISDGQFTSRADLIDAAGSSLGRGALVPGLGKKWMPTLPWKIQSFSNLSQKNLANFLCCSSFLKRNSHILLFNFED